DITRHTVTKTGSLIELTAKEFDLLVILMKNSGKVLTRDTLLDKVWGVEYFGDTRTVDVHVRYLRQKIEDNPDEPVFIQTVRGVGYKFVESN
ncbi:MAG: response regulator transcription factor, partial [Caproiciproducens sp.]|nr:response regulator transcription factor [Caproiciproducens sp.]